MPIDLTCPHCSLQTTADEGYLGQSGPCAGCGRMVTFGTASSGADKRRTNGAAVPLAILAAGFVALLVAGGLVTGLMLQAVTSARQAARGIQCEHNLKQIAKAMAAYHAAYGSFPPAYVADAKGRPLHSWRVLILPYLGQRALYGRYDFRKPWNAPANRALEGEMPRVYSCPSAGRASTETSYLMIVGPDTISDGPGAHAKAEIKDNPAETLLLVETAPSGIGWLEPRDLTAATTNFAVNDASQPLGIRTGHGTAANVLYCDGRVGRVFPFNDEDQIRAMSTIAGNETIEDTSPEF